MIKLSINHTEIVTSHLETLVVGNVNSISIEFAFSPEWEALEKVAVFSNGTSKISLSLSDDTCAIPWEVLSCTGELLVSLRGVGDGGDFVLCTENASLGKVEESLADDDANDPESATANVIDTLIADVAELKENGLSGVVSKTSLASDVQASLGKADTALQSVPNTYRTANAQDLIDNSKLNASDIKLDSDDHVYRIGSNYIAAGYDGNGDEIATKYATKTELNNKVDKVTGKGLSQNDYTDTDKAKVDSAVQPSDIADVATSGDYDDLSNKPTIPTVPQSISAFTNDANYATANDVDSKIATAIGNAIGGAY